MDGHGHGEHGRGGAQLKRRHVGGLDRVDHLFDAALNWVDHLLTKLCGGGTWVCDAKGRGVRWKQASVSSSSSGHSRNWYPAGPACALRKYGPGLFDVRLSGIQMPKGAGGGAGSGARRGAREAAGAR